MKTDVLDKDPLTPGTCEWCGNNCEMEDVACCLSCEAQLHRLEAVQGRMVLRSLKRWRKHRGAKGTPGEGMISEVAATIDGFLRQDRQRREKFGEQRRRAAAEAAAEAAKPKPVKGVKTKLQTSAPVTSEPDPREGVEW